MMRGVNMGVSRQLHTTSANQQRQTLISPSSCAERSGVAGSIMTLTSLDAATSRSMTDTGIKQEVVTPVSDFAEVTHAAD